MDYKKCIPKITLIMGLLLMGLSWVLPYDLLESILAPLRIGGLFTMYICPVIGIIGLVIAIFNKKVWLVIGNLTIFFAFPIMMFVTQLVNIS